MPWCLRESLSLFSMYGVFDVPRSRYTAFPKHRGPGRSRRTLRLAGAVKGRSKGFEEESSFRVFGRIFAVKLSSRERDMIPCAMSDLYPQPELDQLVQVLNRSKDEASPMPEQTEEVGPSPAPRELQATTSPPLPETASSSKTASLPKTAFLPKAATTLASGALLPLLRDMTESGASDLLLITGEPPVIRLHGKLRRRDRSPLEPADLRLLFDPYLQGYRKRQLEQQGHVDFSLELEDATSARYSNDSSDGQVGGSWRFRVNLHRQSGQLAAAIRALPSEIPSLEGLNLPRSMGAWLTSAQGLILLCGATGSGKSSTLAALVGEINRNRACHIVTIEDPVEFVHLPGESVIEHVEVGRDAPSFSEALRSTLRQDPDVILVGEMRDLETISAVLTAAETGHLVMSTLHSGDSTRAISRMVDVFPPEQQIQVRHQLSQALSAIVVQHLIPRIDGGGRVPAVEILRGTYAVRHHIRQNKFEQLYNEILLGQRQGMRSLESSLASLVQAGAISVDEARLRANHTEELETLLRT